MRSLYTFLVVACAFPLVAQIDRSKLPEPAEAKPIEIGDYETFTLKNGLQVFIIENHKLPRVTYRLQLERDPIFEGGKAGFIGMVGEMMERGTKTRTKDELDEEVDFMGASLSVGSTFALASGLSKYSEKVLELMADVIMNPTFPEAELEKIRKQTLSGIQSSKDDPGAISSNLQSKVLFGSDHPYGEIATEETVNSITVDDIKKYHATYYKPNIGYLAVVGDIDPKAAKKLIKKYFGNWESGDVPTHTYDEVKAPESNSVALVNRSNSVQSVIDIVYPVVLKPGSEDVLGISAMNSIFGGGGLSTRLNKNLREDKAYTYGANSSISSDELVSRFSAGAEVRNEVTDSAITEFLYEMTEIRKNLVTDEELELAKNTMAGSFARSLESPQTVASFAINIKRYNLPEDYYNTYLQRSQKLTKEDIQNVAKKYVKPEQAYITIVGKSSDIESGLKKFGTISYFDTYGEPVDPALAKLPAGLTAKDVMSKYYTAVGGREKLDAVKSIKMVMTAEAMGNQLKMTKVAGPKKLSIVTEVGGNVMSEQVYNEGEAKFVQMGRNMPIDDATKSQLELEAFVFPELHYEEMGVKTKLVGLEPVDGTDAYVIEVTNPDGKNYSLYYAVKSGLLLRKSQTVDTPNGQSMTLNTDMGDYQEVEGILFPMSIKIPLGPGMSADGKADSVEINVELSEDMFKTE